MPNYVGNNWTGFGKKWSQFCRDHFEGRNHSHRSSKLRAIGWILQRHRANHFCHGAVLWVALFNQSTGTLWSPMPNYIPGKASSKLHWYLFFQGQKNDLNDAEALAFLGQQKRLEICSEQKIGMKCNCKRYWLLENITSMNTVKL